MRAQFFHENWHYSREGLPETAVLLPHDAQITEKRNIYAKSGINGGWFEGHRYTYRCPFFVPEEARAESWIFEFEGVYHNAEVFLNGTQIAARPYGYSNFFADTEGALQYGAENLLTVIADNSDQPNSRWYSGSGIYRPVRLWKGPKAHILPEGVRIATTAIDLPTVSVSVEATVCGAFSAAILDGTKTLWEGTGHTDQPLQIPLPGARLWSVDAPNLYTCRITLGQDCWEGTFGIRSLSWGTDGLLLNGRRVILRGACIHHDNTLLGAATWADAEERRVRILKENGYNALRSAHNPCSKALLEACDRMGMLMMDELVDCWYIHKTQHDYVDLFAQWWQEDIRSMVRKDFNHPCVILYSTGNEVSETAQEKGIALTREMTEFLHSQDPTRPVTCGVNIFFNFLSSIGFGVYSDEKAKKELEKAEKQPGRKEKAVGSQFFNDLAGLMGDNFMKLGATLPPCDWKTKGAFAGMDIAGYNYGIYRYRHDLKKYPDRLILGSETFCNDAARFWALAQKEPRIIGDFVWAGMDYLGEVGVGSWEYQDYAKSFDHGPGWVSAGSGRIDLTGKPLAEAAYTKVAFGLTDHPVIAVRPVNHTGDKHSPSAWKMTNAIESWSWDGCEGKKAIVEVYAQGHSAALFRNGKKIGQKKLKQCRTTFTTTYEPGELEAVSFTKDGRQLRSHKLVSAGSQTELTLLPESKTVRPGGLVFVRIAYTDANGIIKPLEDHEIQLTVEGGRLLALGNGCPYQEEPFHTSKTPTYWGEALAILLAEQDLTLTASDGIRSKRIQISV